MDDTKANSPPWSSILYYLGLYCFESISIDATYVSHTPWDVFGRRAHISQGS